MKQLNAKAFEVRRAELGLSQAELARSAGVAVGTVCELESGKLDNPKIGTLLRVARVLERPPSFFYAPAVQELEPSAPAA